MDIHQTKWLYPQAKCVEINNNEGKHIWPKSCHWQRAQYCVVKQAPSFSRFLAQDSDTTGLLNGIPSHRQINHLPWKPSSSDKCQQFAASFYWWLEKSIDSHQDGYASRKKNSDISWHHRTTDKLRNEIRSLKHKYHRKTTSGWLTSYEFNFQEFEASLQWTWNPCLLRKSMCE